MPLVPTSSRSAAEEEALSGAACFRVGAHLVRLSRANERWHVTVDATSFERWYASEAEAWEAGVREADRLDQLAAS
jgi:hypothetical protein